MWAIVFEALKKPKLFTLAFNALIFKIYYPTFLKYGDFIVGTSLYFKNVL